MQINDVEIPRAVVDAAEALREKICSNSFLSHCAVLYRKKIEPERSTFLRAAREFLKGLSPQSILN